MSKRYTTRISLSEVNENVLRASDPPEKIYYIILFLLAGGIGAALTAWIFQVRTGMGVSGLNHPVGWGTYISNFVFWVGIAHSGTLISAILYLTRAKWRDAVSRSAEAMTVICVAIAGLFPLIHLGRLWVFYYILPYPSERQIWPNFKSPLVWDLIAVITYFTVSVIFFYVGLLPDLAAARDRSEKKLGMKHIKTRIYSLLSLGWTGRLIQWQNYGRAYLYFAALATPLVISVHSIVSWDFAVGILPGWHSTLFAPYFVAGAIHSGIATVLLLLIPMRKIFSLERIITADHFDMASRIIIATALIIGYSYMVEPAIALYSGSTIEHQFLNWRLTGWIAPLYYPLILLNFLIPLLLVIKKIRRNFYALFFIAFLIDAGMWLERYFIVTGSTAHGFLPHSWSYYSPSIIEIFITLGSFSVLFFFFLVFSKSLPVVPISDYKAQIIEKDISGAGGFRIIPLKSVTGNYIEAVFSAPENLVQSIKNVCINGFNRIEVFSPVRLKSLLEILPNNRIKYWTLAGSIAGLAFGFYLAISSSLLNSNIVDGKHPVELIPFLIIGFEFLVLIGSLSNFAAMIFYSNLYKRKIHPLFRNIYSVDRFGLIIACQKEEYEKVKSLLKNAEQVNER